MVSPIVEMMFDIKRWQDCINRAYEVKGIDETTLRSLSDPEERDLILMLIVTGQYHVAPPHVILIPKDKPGEFREVKANLDKDRIILTLANDVLMEMFHNKIHKSCKSYQKGIGCPEVVRESVDAITSLNIHGQLGYKVDLSKYFDSVKIECIDGVFNMIEKSIGFEPGTEPVCNMLREYYHSDWLYDVNGKLTQQYTSLKQGCAVASFLADVILYDIDDVMTKMCKFYVRYSDDMLIIGDNAEQTRCVLEELLTNYGLKLNPKKVEPIYSNKWFTFLGFAICGDEINLSPNRVLKIKKLIDELTIDSKSNYEDAKRKVIRRFYDGEYNIATSFFSIVTISKPKTKATILALDNYLRDALRACATGKKKIGGIGFDSDYNILRGKGRNVKANKQKLPYLNGFKSMLCLIRDYQISKSLFQATVRGM